MTPAATIVVDLGFGDASKGSIVDFLRRCDPQPTTIIRFNGGSQAAHNVVTATGQHHTFSQFGSGTLVPNTETFLSRFMLVNPFNLLHETESLQNLGVANPLDLVAIDQQALIVSPFQVAVNRLRELARGDGRHGSCGHGVGETTSDHLTHGDSVLFAGDLTDLARTKRKLHFLRDIKLDELREIRDALPDTKLARQELSIFEDPGLIDTAIEVYRFFASRVRIVDSDYLQEIAKSSRLIFEAAQGVLLDEWFGFFPYTTWSTTTFANALQLLNEARFEGPITKLGLLRAYATRHGAGPFVTEDAKLTEAIPDYHNGNNQWQREFRVGHFDLVTARFALEVCEGVDALAITCLDRLTDLPRWRVCSSYHYKGQDQIEHLVERSRAEITALKVPVDNYLEHMGAMTQLLENSTPNYCTSWTRGKGREENYLEFLENTLRTPIAITSHGVTSEDKYLRRTL